MVPCRTGNYTRKVSYGGETRWCHVEQETIRKQFPAVVKHCIVMSDSETIREQFPAPMNHHIAAPSRKLIFRRKIF